MKPGYLLLDVDGVLNPLAMDRPGYHYDMESYCNYSPANGDWLRKMGNRITLVWATAWEGQANNWVSPLHELWDLPVINFERSSLPPSWMDWKLPSIIEWVGEYPFCWIDDDMSEDAKTWADTRNQKIPTLFIQPNTLYGIQSEHKGLIEAWVDNLPSS